MRVSRCTHTSGPPHLLTLHAGTCARPQRGHFHPYRVRWTVPCSSGRCLATEDDHAIATAYHRMSSTPAPPAKTWNHTLPLRLKPRSCGTPGRPPSQYSTPLMPRESPSSARLLARPGFRALRSPDRELLSVAGLWYPVFAVGARVISAHRREGGAAWSVACAERRIQHSRQAAWPADRRSRVLRRAAY